FDGAPATRLITDNIQVRHQPGNGHPADESIRQHGGDVVADAACLRSCRRSQGRKQNQGAPPAHPARTVRALTLYRRGNKNYRRGVDNFHENLKRLQGWIYRTFYSAAIWL